MGEPTGLRWQDTPEGRIEAFRSYHAKEMADLRERADELNRWSIIDLGGRCADVRSDVARVDGRTVMTDYPGKPMGLALPLVLIAALVVGIVVAGLAGHV